MKRWKGFVVTAMMVVLLFQGRVWAAPGDLLHQFGHPSPDFEQVFGFSVAAFGNNVLAGSPSAGSPFDRAGKAFLFDSSTGNLLQTFSNPSVTTNDRFGSSVAGVGNNVAVGDYLSSTSAFEAGAAYLFDSSTGNLLHTLQNPTPEEEDRFGWSMTSYGNKVLVGAPGDSSTGQSKAGAAYLYDGTTGNLLQTFMPPTPDVNDTFGNAIAMTDNFVLVGTNGDDTAGLNAGAAHLFDISTGNLLQTYLNPTPAANDTFGLSVAIVGNHVFVGDPEDDTAGTQAGAVYKFDLTSGAHLQTILDQTPHDGDGFGYSMATVGDNLLVGAPSDNRSPFNGDGQPATGHLIDGDTGEQLMTFEPIQTNNMLFGWSVAAIGDNKALFGAFDDDTFQGNSGAAYLYELPEPGTLSLVGIGASTLLLRRRS